MEIEEIESKALKQESDQRSLDELTSRVLLCDRKIVRYEGQISSFELQVTCLKAQIDFLTTPEEAEVQAE